MTKWDDRYAQGDYATEKPHHLLPVLVNNLPAGRALDLACGLGRHANFLAENGWRVTAVDNSEVGVKIARERAFEKEIDVDFRLLDLENGEFVIKPDSYDLICDFYFLWRDLFPAIKSGVKIGGTVVAAIHIYGDGEEGGHYLLEEGELREIFSDFEIVHYHETSLIDKDTGNHRHRTAEIIAKRII